MCKGSNCRVVLRGLETSRHCQGPPTTEPGTSVPQETGEGTGQTWEGQRLGQGSPWPEGPVGNTASPRCLPEE